MHVIVVSLEKTKEGFPTEWRGETSEASPITILFSYGHLAAFVDGEVLVSWTLSHNEKDGVMQDEDLVEILDGIVEFPDDFGKQD